MAKLPGNVLKTTGLSFRDSLMRVMEKPSRYEKDVPNAILLYIFESWKMFEMIFLNLALNKKQILAENLLGNHIVQEWQNTFFGCDQPKSSLN